jgi:uncharacterized protein YjbI with pentapeptide repeats
MRAKSSTAVLFLIALLGALLGAAAMAWLRRPSTAVASAPPAPAQAGQAPDRFDAVLTDAPAVPREVEPAGDPAAQRAAAAEPADVAETVAWLRAKFPGGFPDLTAAEALELRSLDFRDFPLTDADLARLAPLVHLEDLGLRGTAVTDAGLAHLSGFVHLRGLDLRGTRIDGSGLAGLPAGVEHLDLTRTQVTEAALSNLSGRVALKNVNLNHLALGDAAIATISTLPALAMVELDGTALTDAGLRRLFDDNPRLMRIEVRETKTSAALAEALCCARPGLEIVQQQGVPGFAVR